MRRDVTRMLVIAGLILLCTLLAAAVLVKRAEAADKILRPPPLHLSQRYLMECEFLREDGSIAWTRSWTRNFPPPALGDTHSTWLDPIDPDPHKGRCRAQSMYSRPEGYTSCEGDTMEGRWCLSDWSEWSEMDGPPVPVPEPAVWMGLLAGIGALAGLARRRGKGDRDGGRARTATPAAPKRLWYEPPHPRSTASRGLA